MEARGINTTMLYIENGKPELYRHSKCKQNSDLPGINIIFPTFTLHFSGMLIKILSAPLRPIISSSESQYIDIFALLEHSQVQSMTHQNHAELLKCKFKVLIPRRFYLFSKSWLGPANPYRGGIHLDLNNNTRSYILFRCPIL